jgi:hypothetical protein
MVTLLCLAKFHIKSYRPKSLVNQEAGSLKGSPHNPSHPPVQSVPSSSPSNPPLSPSLVDERAASLASMVNTPMNPEPLVPRGFVICNRSQEEDTPPLSVSSLSSARPSAPPMRMSLSQFWTLRLIRWIIPRLQRPFLTY